MQVGEFGVASLLVAAGQDDLSGRRTGEQFVCSGHLSKWKPLADDGVNLLRRQEIKHRGEVLSICVGLALDQAGRVYNVDDLSVGATPSSFTARRLATAVNLLRCPFSRPGPPVGHKVSAGT